MEIHPQHPENFRPSREYFQEIHEWYKEESTNSTTEYEYCRSKDSNPGVSSGELVPTPLAHQSLRGVLGTGHTYCEILQPIYEKFFFPTRYANTSAPIRKRQELHPCHACHACSFCFALMLCLMFAPSCLLCLNCMLVLVMCMLCLHALLNF